MQPLTEAEKLGSAYTKMNKDLIINYGPGMFDGFVDNDQFDGGDSEMGLSGDGTTGLRKLGRDVTPHMTRTTGAIRSRGLEPHEEIVMSQSMTYSEELLHSNPSMDSVRAQQLENWAEQREISNHNKHLYYENPNEYEINVLVHEEESHHFSNPVEAGGDYEGIITLRAPLNGVVRQDIWLRNPYMGFAEFRAAFVGDTNNDWFVTPNDGVLKQHEDTHFAVTFRPSNHGVTSGYLVIETDDFKKTWKVVGSTGDQYEF